MTPEAICLAFVLGAAASGHDRAAPLRPETEVAAVSAHLIAWLREPGSTSADALRERVARGAPPAALIAMLDAFQQAPRVELLDVVQQLASYRRVDVRARALVAWAAAGPSHSDRAIAAAATDMAPSIRRLALALSQRHPSAAAEVHVREMLAHDAALAAEAAALQDATADVDEAALDDEIIVLEPES
ncbi:MAG: hypothetical protein K1X88_10465 [Nannocystaceae bacterium]|nr:hypothetical protein [Nannocystaceae bacterium]